MAVLMKIKVIVLAFLAAMMCVAQKLAADVILVHGSLAKTEDWYRPSEHPSKGLFYKELSNQANRLGLGKVIPFSWSGKSGLGSRKMGVIEHIKAAEHLTKLIRDGFSKNAPEHAIKLDGPLYLVGHSNGGVVETIATQMLFNPHSSEAEGRPVPALFGRDSRAIPALKTKIESAQNSSDVSRLEKKVNQTTTQCRRLIADAVERMRKTYSPSDRSQIKVAQLIMIATPIDQSLYTANMHVVDKVCSLFSEDDSLQKNFARDGRRYPKGSNVMNFRVAVRSPGGGIYYPFHTQMRHHSVARYLLSLMSDTTKVGGVPQSKFASTMGMDVLFEEQPGPDDHVAEFEVIRNLKMHAFPKTGFDE